MSSSHVQHFEECLKATISRVLPEGILPAVIEFYDREKGAKASLEELQQWLQLSDSGGLIPPQIKSSSRSKTTSPEALEEKPKPGEGCIYKYQRGKTKKGKYCGKPCFPGLNYCKNCKNKQAVRKLLKKEREGKGEGDGGKAFTGKFSADGTGSKKGKQEDPTLNVHPYGQLSDHFIHPETNFILKEEEGVIFAVAKEREDKELCALTEEEKVVAKKLKLTVIEEEEKETEVLQKLKTAIESEGGNEGTGSEASKLQSIPTTEKPLISRTKIASNIPKLPDIPPVPAI